MDNLLDNWKAECYVLSSELSRSKQLERAHVDTIYNKLLDFFGSKYFQRPIRDENSNENWIHYLLINWNRPACIAAVFEVVNILDYLSTFPRATQKKFKTLLNDHRQFRDIFFEIYVIRILEYNNIQVEKKQKEGKKELDLVCIIGEQQFLGECRKIYAPGMNLLNVQKHLVESLYIKLKTLNKGFGFIGTIKLNKVEDSKSKLLFDEKIDKFISLINSTENFHTVDYHDIDANGTFSVVNYSQLNLLERENENSKYDILFKVIPPVVSIPNIPNLYSVEISLSHPIPRWKLERKLFSAFKEKNEQHSNSIYTKKIYFIDSEVIPEFQFSIFQLEGMFEQERINEHITNTFSENEVFCFIRRDYMGIQPKVVIKAFGKNIDLKVKDTLEGLNTIFDYHIEVSK